MPIPILYARGRTRTVHDQPHRAEFRCESCKYESEAVVFGSGTGSEAALSKPGTAHADALRRAAAEASENLRIVPCPQCGHRDPRARSFLKRLAIRAVVLVAIVTAVILFLSPPTWLVVAAIGLTGWVLVVSFGDQLERWRSASRNVWFLREIEHATDYRSPPARVAGRRKLSRAKIDNLPRLSG